MKIKVRKNKTSVICARLVVGGIPVVASIISSCGKGEVNMTSLDNGSRFREIREAGMEATLAAAVLRNMGLTAPPENAAIYLAV